MPTGMSCEGSQMPDGTYIPKGQVREVSYGGVRYRCVGCGGCTPITSGSSGSGSSVYTPFTNPKLSNSQQMAVGLFGAFMSGFLGGLSGAMFDDDSTNVSQMQKQYEQQRRLEEEKRKQEERKKQLLSQYNSLLAQAKTQTQPKTSQSSSPFTFQTLGGQLTAFSWQSPSVNSKDNTTLSINDEKLITVPDINSIFGNVIQEKITERIGEKIDEYGGKIVERLDRKYGKEWGSRYYDKGLPIVKIAVTAKTEGIAQAGAETIDYGISLIPMPNLTKGVSDIGRMIYSKIAFTSIDKFLSQTESAANVLGFDFNKDEFMQRFEDDMTTGQKIIYKWLKGD
ncbi:MAG: hypothetical protein N3A62_02240 [Thermodesulfovibrionales bacterium]|nr:hypothetical protein [Thermodesulfovibrionales bacterium]